MVHPADDRLGRAIEDYLKAVFSLQFDSDAVSTTALAERLGISAAAATKAVHLLSSRKLAKHRPYRGVTLSARGRREALRVIRRHRLIERFLHDVLGYSWDEVDAEAERLEHHVSDRFITAVDRLLDHPRLDPHGDPIPEVDGTVAQRLGRPLAECAAHDIVVIVRVRDRDPAVLQYLGRVGLRPEAIIEIVDREPFEGPLTWRPVGDTGPSRVLGREVARDVFVMNIEMTADGQASAIGEAQP